jgi:hypothetical protein
VVARLASRRRSACATSVTKGALSMLSADEAAPCDRPNLSKDYLAGTAPEDWIPLQAPGFYAEHDIDLRLGCDVAAIDANARQVSTTSGERIAYDDPLLATGAEPRRLSLPGFEQPNVFALRSLADARAIIAASATAKSVALVGAGFIGMEAGRGIARPRARGARGGARCSPDGARARAGTRRIRHRTASRERCRVPPAGERQGIRRQDAHARRWQSRACGRRARRRGGRPAHSLAVAAAMEVQDGIVVDAFLETSVQGHFAAGDVARYPYDGGLIRVEHWVHAERQGQAAAANMLGAHRPFTDVPFFWTHHYGLDLRYTGHAQELGLKSARTERWPTGISSRDSSAQSASARLRLPSAATSRTSRSKPDCKADRPADSALGSVAAHRHRG